MAVPTAAGIAFRRSTSSSISTSSPESATASVAGVSAANTADVHRAGAPHQVLGVGAVALIAQAVGRKDQAGANVVFNQSVLLAFSARPSR